MGRYIAESTLINETFACTYVNLATARSVEELQKNSLSKYFLALGIFIRTFIKLLSKRYDRVYITLFPYGFAFVKDACVILLARLFGYKPLVHLHTYGFRKAGSGSPFRKKLYTFVFRNMQAICLSRLLIEDIEPFYKGKVFILPNGIPQVNFENTYAVSDAPVKLLYLSNLIRGKGILVLIDALEIIKKQGYDFHLRVAGSEYDITYGMLETLIKEKNLEKEVTLAGPKFDQDKYDEFRKAGIFILPSDYDTFGLVLLEAMQFGVPCISTHIGGIPDVLGKGRGLMITEITGKALAEALAYLIKHPQERQKMSALGFEYFKSHFTLTLFIESLKNILDNQPREVDERLSSIQI